LALAFAQQQPGQQDDETAQGLVSIEHEGGDFAPPPVSAPAADRAAAASTESGSMFRAGGTAAVSVEIMPTIASHTACSITPGQIEPVISIRAP